MKRRDFFKRTAGVVIGAAVASRAKPAQVYQHIEYQPFAGRFTFDEAELKRIAQRFAESARLREERMALSVFNNSFSR